MNLSFNVGMATPYNIPLAPGGPTGATASGTSSSAATGSTDTSGDSVKISPTAALLQASANAALLAATMGGTAAVTYSTVPTATPAATSAAATQPDAVLDDLLSGSATTQSSALAQLQATDPAEALQLGSELTLLQGSGLPT